MKFPRAGQNILSSYERTKRFSNILLMGPPGCGKTTVGRLIAPKLNMKWFDIDDDCLEPAWAKSVAQKLSLVGDKEFLRLEEQELTKINCRDTVISLSGSIPLRCEGLKHLSRDGLVVYLDSSLDSIVERLTMMKVDRIVGHRDRGLAEVLKERFDVYEKSYDIRVVIGKNQSPEEIAKNVISAIESRKTPEYHSTRGDDKNRTFHHTLISGLAKDKGLYLPESFIPFSGIPELSRMVDLSYQEICIRILEKFPTVTPWRIHDIVNDAYSSFSHPEVAPVTLIDGKRFALETFHGPTASFKDLSLQLLPKLFQASMSDSKQKQKPALLVATSGDTGSAALDGFGRAGGTPIVVLYPSSGVSSVQKAQMVRAPGNVCVVGVRSDFDWCQGAVKQLLNGNDALPAGFSWTSANSINFGRLLPQVCFMVHSYLSLVRQGKLVMGDPIDVTVPTGNFGFIFSASIAKRMGIPIRKLICASNDNNVLSEFIKTGKYDIRGRNFFTTASPAIDILISSNLERWIYMLLRDDYTVSHEQATTKVSQMMESLSTKRFFQVEEDLLRRIQSIMSADWCSEEECLRTIKNTWQERELLVDPHSAVALKVSSSFCDPEIPMVVACTAHWAKFPEAIIESLSSNNPSHRNIQSHQSPLEQQFAILQKLAPSQEIPRRLLDLVDSEPLHNLNISPCIKELSSTIDSYLSTSQ